IQSQYSKEPAVGGILHTRIARFDLMTDTWEFFLYPFEVTTTPGDSLSLSEIINLGKDHYAVIERDKQLGSRAKIKTIYRFTLDGVTPFSGLVTDSSDLSGHVIEKSLLFDVRDDFSPFEKVEGLALTRDHRLWASLNNEGGAVEPRLVRVGFLDGERERDG